MWTFERECVGKYEKTATATALFKSQLKHSIHLFFIPHEETLKRESLLMRAEEEREREGGAMVGAPGP